jgi:DNA-binding FadR family transcriptional regulator
VDSHAELIACLHGRDRAGAGAAMRAHLAVTADAVSAALTAQGVAAETLRG